MKSKYGKVILIIFGVFVASSFVYSWLCDDWFCGVWILIPAVPWIFLFSLDFINSSDSESKQITLTWFIGVIANAGILYALGYYIERLRKRKIQG